ncbi:MAG: hypothetical protein HKN54_01830 [Flavobacteriaceae bacterium]|nr:hypothetical protein [Flavobacteriaceae bacterium]
MIFLKGLILGQLSYLHDHPIAYDLLDKLNTTGIASNPHLSIRPLNIMDILEINPPGDSLDYLDDEAWNELIENIPERYHFNLADTTAKTDENKALLGVFYKDPTSFLTVDEPNFFLKIDPLIHFSLGDDFKNNGTVFQNTRGIQIRGTIDKKVYFHTSIFENQQGFLNYFEDEISRINAIPGQGFFRPYSSGVINGLKGWDFLNARAYGGFKISPSIDLQLGHSRHFIGNGMRSLLLSDYAHNYFYLQLNTKIWKFHYQNTFAELSADSSKDLSGNNLLPKKYMATHYLNFQASPRFSIGLFESVIFSRTNHFEFQYLNPVILYRSVEQFLDSPDNAMLGFNIQWIPKNGWQLYSQLLIDELRTGEAFSGNGWWGNKTGFQVGLKLFDPFKISGLMIQVEHNTVRPYTYAHRSEDINSKPVTSYSHFNQPLAHPYGANFRETIFNFKYRLHKNINASTILLFSKYGHSDSANVGRDILLNYESRQSDFGNFIGQGLTNSIFAFHFNTSWQFFPNYYIDLKWIFRNQSVENESTIHTNYFGVGLRANIHQQHALF